MADLEITVDFTSITQGEKTVVQLERQLDRLVKRFDNGAIEADAFRTGLIGLKREYAGLGVSIQKASGQVEKYVRATQRANAEQRKAADQKEWFANQRRRIRMMEESRRMEERQARESARIHSEGERAAKSHADELERLARRYRPLYAVSKLYEKELNDINRAHKEGVLNARQHASAVDLLNQEYQDFQNGVASATNRFRGSMVGSTRSLNDFGMATQQVGYQVGDFLVQVQSGTNVFVAFGQQATQLVGILPMFASALKISAGTLVAISAGLGIVIPLVTALAAAFVRTRDEGKSFSDLLSELETSVSNYKSAMKEASAETTELNARFGKVSESMRPFLQDLQELERINALNRVAAQFEALETESGGFFRALQEGLVSASFAQEENAKALGLNLESYASLTKKVNELRSAETSSDRFSAAKRIRDFIQETVGDTGDMTDEMRRFYQNLVEAVLTAGELEGEVEGAEGSTSRLADEANRAAQAFVNASNNVMGLQSALNSLSMPFLDAMEELDFEVASAGMSAADKLVATRVRNMEQQMRAASERVFGFDYGLTPEQREQLSEFESALRSNVGTLTGGGSSDGGGGGASGVGQDVFGFARQFMGEEDQAQVWYDQQLEKLQDFNEQELDILRRHGIDKETIEEEYQSRLMALRDAERKTTLGAYSQLFGNIAAVAEAGGKKLVGIQKAASVAQAAINSYLAYTEVLKDPSLAGRPLLRQVLAASTLAAGFAQVANIASTSYGNSGGGGGRGTSGGGGSIATPQAASQAPQRVVIEGLDPSALYSGEMIQSIFDAIYDENEERGAVFMVAT